MRGVFKDLDPRQNFRESLFGSLRTQAVQQWNGHQEDSANDPTETAWPSAGVSSGAFRGRGLGGGDLDVALSTGRNFSGSWQFQQPRFCSQTRLSAPSQELRHLFFSPWGGCLPSLCAPWGNTPCPGTKRQESLSFTQGFRVGCSASFQITSGSHSTWGQETAALY